MTSITETFRVGNGRTDGVVWRFGWLQFTGGEDFFNGRNDLLQHFGFAENIATGETHLAFGFTWTLRSDLKGDRNNRFEFEQVSDIVDKG